MGEELHEIQQQSSNEEYIEDKDRKGSNLGIEEEADEIEESVLQGDDDGRNKGLPLLHVQPNITFHLSLKENGGPKHLLL